MIEFALFGAGRIVKICAANLARQAGARLKYVVDTHAPSAEALACEHGALAVDVVQAHGDPAIHAVVIASSTNTHSNPILTAANAGKAVFCGRPVDLTVARLHRGSPSQWRHPHYRLPATLRSDIRRAQGTYRARRHRRPGNAGHHEP